MNKILAFIFLLGLGQSYAQNRVDFFKDIPPANESFPAWALEMYSEDANVKKVIFEYDQYYRKHDFVKNLHTQNYKHWLKQVYEYMEPDGSIRVPSQKEQNATYESIKSKRNNNAKAAANWSCIGPFETYKNGSMQKVSVHANVYSIDQSLTNANILIAGCEAGGVFHTADKGITWNLISKNEVFVNGITAVVIHPTNNSIFHITGNSRIYRTTDAGLSWTEVFFIDGSGNEIKYDPANSNHLWCTSSKGLHESTNGGLTWTTRFNQKCWDLDYHPANSSIVYLLKSNVGAKKTEFYKSTDGGINFNLVSAGWYVPENTNEASESGGKIGVSPNSPNRVYAALIGSSKAGDDGWIGVYRSDNSGDTWYLPSGQIGGPYSSINTMPWNAAAYSSGYHQGYYNFDLEVSPTNANLFWFGTVRLSESSDGGTSYISIGAANSQRLSDIHADIQDIEVMGSDIWVASDGGVNFSNDNLSTHESRKANIIGSDFWGFANGWNEDIYVGGKYHNGNSAYYQTYGLGNTHNVGGVEEATGYINPLENKHAYFNEYWAGGIKKRSLPDMLGGSASVLATYSLIPNESYVESSSSGYYFHPNYANHIIAGRDSVIYKSMDGGASWQVLYDFAVTGRVFGIEISRTNPDIMYCVWQPNGGYWDWCEIYKSVDGGTTWNMLPNPPTNNRWRLEIAISDANPNHLYVACNDGSNGNKVYETTNGGTSWNNISSAVLDGEDLKDIFVHSYSGGNVVYVVSSTGSFYWTSSSAIWNDFSTGLPTMTRGFKLLPFFKDNKIRLGTTGRGIWESNLAMPALVQAMPMTLDDTVSCARDTVQFDSYSILDQNASAYLWSFTPAPLYVSSTAARNPKVVFGQNGSYDVSLTVTDALMNTSNRTLTGMVTVDSQCDPDTVAGYALKTANSGDYVQLPDMNLMSNNFSVTAWVKPDGVQNDYSSILMNDGDAAGLNFREGNNTLAYHWPGGAWWWDSNLVVPAGEWSHVALVATPTSITVYLNGKGATHNTSPGVVDIGTMKIGSYKAWGDRNYKGEIDEVCIWDRALSQDEIRSHRHLTKEDLLMGDPNLISYFQFNEMGSQALDRKGLNHGVLNSGSTRVLSDAPVGSGESQKMMVNAGGVYDFANTGVMMEFPGAGTYPNGELVVSRINGEPNVSPGNNNQVPGYWIINNYGSPAFSNLSALSFNVDAGDPGTSSMLNSINLFRRTDNEHLNNWVNLCNPTIVGSGPAAYYNFGGACAINSFSQFVVYDFCLHSKYVQEDYINGEIETVMAGHDIQAINLINNQSDIKYKAAQEVLLDIDFEVGIGADFEAYIGGCR